MIRILREDIDAVRKQYSYIPAEDFDKIIRLDPTFNEDRNSVGKYGKWLLGLYNKEDLFNGYWSRSLPEILSDYDRLKNDRTKEIEKDIMKIKSVDDLVRAIFNVKDAPLSKKQLVRQAKKNKDYDLVFEGDVYWVFVPKNHDGDMALASFGHSQKAHWCTAADSEDGIEKFNHYLKQGKYYVLINQNDFNAKYQFHFESNQFANWLNGMDGKYFLNHVIEEDEKLYDFFVGEGYQKYLQRRIIETTISKECIKGATLLSKEEAEHLLTQEERKSKRTEQAKNNGLTEWKNGYSYYWLRSPSKLSSRAYSVDDYGYVNADYYVFSQEVGVRPILILDSINLENGNHFYFGGYGFTIISDTLAICDVIIDACPFNKNKEDGNDYETSYIKKYVDNWFNKAYAEYDNNTNKTESYKRIRLREK